MIQLRHRQPSLWHSGLAKDIEDLWEPWMKEVDQLLEDAALVESVYEAQGKRHRKSRTHGRTQTPAEVALRLLILKHVRNWSYDTLEREVRANLVYRAFTRIGDEKVPDAKTLARLGQVIGPEVITELHERLMALARGLSSIVSVISASASANSSIALKSTFILKIPQKSWSFEVASAGRCSMISAVMLLFPTAREDNLRGRSFIRLLVHLVALAECAPRRRIVLPHCATGCFGAIKCLVGRF